MPGRGRAGHPAVSGWGSGGCGEGAGGGGAGDGAYREGDLVGGEVQVPTLNGTETVSIPERTQPGTRFRLRGKGMPNVSGRGRGDLFAAVNVAIPKKLSREQKALIEQLGDALPQPVIDPEAPPKADEDRPFFERVKDIFG